MVADNDGTVLDDCNAWALETRLTDNAEYSLADEKVYNDALDTLASNEVLLAGGFWSYLTWPRVDP